MAWAKELRKMNSKLAQYSAIKIMDMYYFVRPVMKISIILLTFF